MEPRVLTFDDQGSGEPIILVPGGMTGWVSWIPHQRLLANRHRVIRVQPIHNELGSAGVPGDPAYTDQTERESLRLTFDALELASAHVAAWSAGGRAALEFAMAHPERVRTLTLIEPEVLWVLEQLGESTDEVAHELEMMDRLFGRPVTEDELAEFLVAAGIAPSMEPVREHPNWERWIEHRTTLSWQSSRLARPDRRIDELSGVTHPTLLVKGTASTELSRRMVDVLRERLPHATVVELEGGHASHIESIDAFIQAFEHHLAVAEP